ncbi:MAG: type II secretion system protein, partial [Candidatus Gracilibacteria bacterium]|nr:type II secretion system protein [Candidatus Gracilibacteria bacterium]
MQHTNNKAFTLVELIVTISIIVILGTISFLSYSHVSSSARDSQRISNVSIITKGIDVSLASGKGINTSDAGIGENIVIFGSGGKSFTGYYGKVGKKFLSSINVLGKDIQEEAPKEYEYTYIPDNHYYQIKTLLENPQSTVFFVPHLMPEAFAESTQQYVYLKGNLPSNSLLTGYIQGLIPQDFSGAVDENNDGIKEVSGTASVLKNNDIITVIPPIAPPGALPIASFSCSSSQPVITGATPIFSAGTASISDQSWEYDYSQTKACSWTCPIGYNKGVGDSCVTAQIAYWNGTVDTNWFNAANWSGSILPGLSSDIVINDTIASRQPIIDLSLGAVTFASLTLGTGATPLILTTYGSSVSGLVVTKFMTIGSNGTLTHVANSTTKTHTLTLKVQGNLTIESGGKIDVSGKGYVGAVATAACTKVDASPAVGGG